MTRFHDLDYLAKLDELAPGWERDGGGSAFPLLGEIAVFAADGQGRAGGLDLRAVEQRAIPPRSRSCAGASSPPLPRRTRM